MTLQTANAIDTQYTRRVIEQRCEAALQRADVAGVFPVPIDQVLEEAGVEEIIDISQLPVLVAAAKPRGLKRLLGALIPKERVVFVDFDQVTGRVLWTKSHEATHKLLPWHEAAVALDDKHRLYHDSGEALEVEANLGAAYLIFQGRRTMDRALDYRVGLDAPLIVADEVGASMSATIRFYAEHHPEPIALLQTGRLRDSAGKVPIYLHTASPAWFAEFGDPSRLFGPRLDLSSGPLAHVVPSAGAGTERVEARMVNHNQERSRIVVEAFDNHHTLFFMIRRQRKLELGRRVRAVSA